MADATGKSNKTGSALMVREPLVVTAERIANFCIAVGETNPLYIDPAAAAAGPTTGSSLRPLLWPRFVTRTMFSIVFPPSLAAGSWPVSTSNWVRRFVPAIQFTFPPN